MHHFKQNYEFQRKKLQSSDFFFRSSEFCVNLVIFAEKPVAALLH